MKESKGKRGAAIRQAGNPVYPIDRGRDPAVMPVSGLDISGGRLNNGTGTDTSGADPHLFIITGGNRNLYVLQIRQPASSAFVMGMADIVSGDRTFAAYFTLLSHFQDSFVFSSEEGRYTTSPWRWQVFS